MTETDHVIADYPEPRALHWILFGLLVAFNLYQLLTHAMWRDELLAWSIARESSTLSELYQNRQYEGFPLLWHLLLWLLTFLTHSPLIMQLFHFACALAAHVLIMTRAPFSPGLRLAIVAGYYLSFEYCIISRAYVLGVLLTTIFCACHEWLLRHPVIRGGILGLLANSSVFGAILSLALAADELIPALLRRKQKGATAEGEPSGMGGCLVTYGALLLIAVISMLPPPDDTFAAGWNINPDLNEKFYVLGRLLIAMVPIQIPRITFWNTLAALDAGVWLALPVSIVVLFAVWIALRPSPRYLMVFSLGFMGIWIFSVVKFLGKIRHSGTVMILFIACLWLMLSALKKQHRLPPRATSIAMWGILTANLVAWGIASYYHLRYDFSGAREMARIIERSGTNPVIVGDIDYATSTVAGYLGRPIYFATSRKAGTFITWNAERADVGPAGVLDLAGALARPDSRILLLLNYPLESGNARYLARTADAIVADETFFLYEYVR